MKVGDLVSMAFAREQQPGIVIHMSHSGTYSVLIDGVLHRATESMLSIINDNR
jgi:hypothetical protein